jgi:hypothetical protein
LAQNSHACSTLLGVLTLPAGKGFTPVQRKSRRQRRERPARAERSVGFHGVSAAAGRQEDQCTSTALLRPHPESAAGQPSAGDAAGATARPGAADQMPHHAGLHRAPGLSIPWPAAHSRRDHNTDPLTHHTPYTTHHTHAPAPRQQPTVSRPYALHRRPVPWRHRCRCSTWQRRWQR